MEFNPCKEQICIKEVIYDSTVEQSVEIEYVLPDYYPNVFKVLRTSIDTQILSKNVVDGRITLDGVSMVKIIYLSEDSNKMCQIEQKQSFTKVIELKEKCDNLDVIVKSKCGYVNCRAINSRRVDVRGVVELSVTTIKDSLRECITDCENLQLHKEQLEICDKNLYMEKEFSIKEELQVGQGNFSIQDILNYKAVGVVSEYKLLVNKVVFKGEILVHTLYTCNERPQEPQIIQHSIPFSNIIDFDGIDEDYKCSISLETLKFDIDMQVEENGECHLFVAQLALRAKCIAVKNKIANIIDDAYSTSYEANIQKDKIKLERFNMLLNENTMIKQSLKINQVQINNVYDILSEVDNSSIRIERGKKYLDFNLKLSILGLDEEGNNICLNEVMPCSVEIKVQSKSEQLNIREDILIKNIGYTIISMNELEVRIEIQINGVLFDVFYKEVTTKIEVNTDKKKNREDNCSLRIYFADEGENIWQIAKKYNTSVKAILEENTLDSEEILTRGMILIPIVD